MKAYRRKEELEKIFKQVKYLNFDDYSENKQNAIMIHLDLIIDDLPAAINILESQRDKDLAYRQFHKNNPWINRVKLGDVVMYKLGEKEEQIVITRVEAHWFNSRPINNSKDYETTHRWR